MSISDFTLNGQNFGSFNSGSFDLVGNGSQEIPKFEVQLGNSVQLVPLPTASVLSLAGVGLVGLRRRRAAL